jgi:hypothetical protein
LVSDITDWGDFFTRENEGECLSFRWCSEDLVFLFWEEESKTYKLKEIIGHPVMIGDVIDWIEKKDFDINKKIPWFWFDDEEGIADESKLFLIQDYYTDEIIAFWDKKRESIESQSDECIDYIYSLIGK